MFLSDPKYVSAGFSKTGLGMNITPPPGTSDGILAGLMLLVTGTLSTIFVLRVLKYEKEPIWKAIGFAAMGGSAIAAIHGTARILSEFVPEKKS